MSTEVSDTGREVTFKVIISWVVLKKVHGC